MEKNSYKIDIKADSVQELIFKLRYFKRELNEEVNTIIMTPAMANSLWFELNPKNRDDILGWKNLVKARYMGLDLLLVEKSDHNYIEVVKIWK